MGGFAEPAPGLCAGTGPTGDVVSPEVVAGCAVEALGGGGWLAVVAGTVGGADETLSTTQVVTLIAD